jgi:predicted DsbA family dithiol-disulfide isomerase
VEAGRNQATVLGIFRGAAVLHVSGESAARRSNVEQVPIVYFSDLLCLWAHISELRVDAAKAAYGEQVQIEYRFCSVFGDTARKIAVAWGDKGGYAGFNEHLRHAAGQFPEVQVNSDIWLTVRPASSTGPHLFLRAIHLDEVAGGCAPQTFEKTVRGLRKAFFEEARDIALWEVQCAVGRNCSVNIARIEALIDNGAAFAALASDYQDAAAMGIQGSPSFVLNDGRQKLFGNVGFRILDANIQELLRTPETGQASWC